MPKIGYKECRRWVGERAWESAEGGEAERVPRMGNHGQKRRGMVRRLALARWLGEAFERVKEPETW